jgi:hypothetical protein
LQLLNLFITEGYIFFQLFQTFFKEVDRLLVENGMCTIVTDNLWYGKFLCRLIGTQLSLKLRSLSSKDSKLINSSWIVQHDSDNCVLWVGEPGHEAGHIVDASSYFDRYYLVSILVFDLI